MRVCLVAIEETGASLKTDHLREERPRRKQVVINTLNRDVCAPTRTAQRHKASKSANNGGYRCFRWARAVDRVAYE